ncbi:MAG: hypothetical protein QM758_02950 [Armatimonas sp.]
MLFGRRRFVHRFTCQLLFLLEEGVPFLMAMELVALQYPRRGYYSITILDVRHRVREEESFSQALSYYMVFDRDYRRTIAWADGSSAKLLIALRLLSNNLTQRKNSPLFPAYSNRYTYLEDCLTENKNVPLRN